MLWGCSPTAETSDLKSVQYGFESHQPYPLNKIKMKTKIHVLSSLYCHNKEFIIPKVEADILIVGGNGGSKLSFINPLITAAPRYQKVYVVLGNTDYQDKDMVYIRSEIKQALDKYEISNVSILNNNFQVLRSESTNLHLAGCTLWTDFSDKDQDLINSSKLLLSDFSGGITNESSAFEPDDVIQANSVSKRFLTWFSEQPLDGKKIVITHSIPSIKLIQEDVKDNPLVRAFVSNCEHLFKNIDLWICGHEYCKLDTMINGCRVLGNSRGLTSNSKNFNPELVIEI